mmetsp:Transcript_108876/g.213313  ORF Transcript_108876/g.213313 Transcript_108876/m.213313 type:complete len:519 (-) Transcript_108876:213-1769(-)
MMKPLAEEADPERGMIARNYVFILAAVAALNNCNLGYDMGIVSGVGPILLDQQEFPVSEVQLEIFIGALDISSLIGAAASNYLADKFGRKACMALSEILFLVSVIGMACAQNYTTLVIFRCVCGVGVGLGLTIGPLYIGELAPQAVRGKLVSWSEIATNVGLLVAFIVGASFSSLPEYYSWRVMLALGSLLPAILLVSLFFMPESPRWLIVQKREDEAAAVLRDLYSTEEEAMKELEEIKTTIAAEEIIYTQGGWHTIFHPTKPIFYALCAGIGIASIQQLSGIEALTSYFLFIFRRANLKSSGAYVYLILFGVCKLFTVYAASKYFDNPNCGRRPLLLFSGVGVFICMGIFALCFSFPISDFSMVVVVITMFAYVITYSVGYGPGTWIVMLEVLPMQIRAKGLSVSMFVNRCMASLLSGTFLTLVQYMMYAGYFWFFSAITLGCVIYVYFLIPETQGRTLEKMAEVFGGGVASLAESVEVGSPTRALKGGDAVVVNEIVHPCHVNPEMKTEKDNGNE